jgi:hypothetical protein
MAQADVRLLHAGLQNPEMIINPAPMLYAISKTTSF